MEMIKKKSILLKIQDKQQEIINENGYIYYKKALVPCFISLQLNNKKNQNRWFFMVFVKSYKKQFSEKQPVCHYS
jgi:hypothetical protein